MSDQPPESVGHRLIRIYLLFATIGAVISLPLLALFGWYGWEWTKEGWPGNWPGWAVFALISLVLVAGPFVGRALFKRGRPGLALAVSAGAYLLPSLIVVGLLAG